MDSKTEPWLEKLNSPVFMLALRAWEKDQLTNPKPVNPHAFIYGYTNGYDKAIDLAIEAAKKNCSLVLVHELELLKSKK